MFGKKDKPTEDGNWKSYFAIYDSKVKHYRPPILAVNDLDVLRGLDNHFRDPAQQRHELVLNAEDFSLFKLGHFNVKTGELVPCSPIEHVVNLHDIRASAQRDLAKQNAVMNEMKAATEGL